MDINVSGLFRVTRAVVPVMRRGGSIVTIGSINSLVAWPNNVAYTTSKGAALLFTRALALDVVGRGIRANCVCPGLIDTPLTDGFLEASEDPQALLAEYAAVAPMGRLGTAAEVANCVAFLASDEASFVTGSALVVDGRQRPQSRERRCSACEQAAQQLEARADPRLLVGAADLAVEALDRQPVVTIAIDACAQRRDQRSEVRGPLPRGRSSGRRSRDGGIRPRSAPSAAGSP